jgi:hypothetical protein
VTTARVAGVAPLVFSLPPHQPASRQGDEGGSQITPSLSLAKGLSDLNDGNSVHL